MPIEIDDLRVEIAMIYGLLPEGNIDLGQLFW
jgi:hypothetical protein